MPSRRRRRRRSETDDSPRTDAEPGPAANLDRGTAAELALFNARLREQAERERAERRVAEAVRRKDAAAARVRAVEQDPLSTATQRSEAAAAYREVIAELDRLQRGGPSTPGDGSHEDRPADAGDDGPDPDDGP